MNNLLYLKLVFFNDSQLHCNPSDDNLHSNLSPFYPTHIDHLIDSTTRISLTNYNKLFQPSPLYEIPSAKSAIYEFLFHHCKFTEYNSLLLPS